MSELEEYDVFAGVNQFINSDISANASFNDSSDVPFESPFRVTRSRSKLSDSLGKEEMQPEIKIDSDEDVEPISGRDLIARASLALKTSKTVLAKGKKNQKSQSLVSSVAVPPKNKRKSNKKTITPAVANFVTVSSEPNFRIRANEGTTITIDSDDELITTKEKKKLESSFESENYEMSVKIKWNADILKFSHRKHQKFGDLIANLAKKENVSPECIMLNIGDKTIRSDDTPDSINYKISTFITGRIMKSGFQTTPVATKKKLKNIIQLKIQSDKFKKPLLIDIGKDQSMRALIVKCSEELKCKPESITLTFDGDEVELNDTPNDLELDGGEILDIRFK